MKIEKDLFLKQLQKIIEVEHSINFESKFSELDNIDSLTYMTISAWMSDRFDTKVSANEIEKMSTIQDLYILLK
jgi:acyl carrier protein